MRHRNGEGVLSLGVFSRETLVVLAASLFLACSLLLLPGLSLIFGGPLVSLFRTSINLGLLLSSVAGLVLIIIGVIGVIGLSLIYYRGHSIPYASLIPTIILLESMGILAAFIIKISSNIQGLPAILLAMERGLWFSLGYVALFLMPLSAIIFLVEILSPRWFQISSRYNTDNSGYQGEILLIMGVILGLMTPLITHMPPLNPSLSIVSTDTIFNLRFIGELRDEGLLNGILSLAETLRPLYLLFIYAISMASPVDLSVLFDVLIPAIGFILIAITVYWLLAPVAPPRTRGLASILAVLYWSPAFTYGGFQTNLLAIPIALAATRFLWDGKLVLFTIATIILGLWHPWTMTYYIASWVLYLALSGRLRHLSTGLPLGRAAMSIIMSLAAVVLAHAMILYLSSVEGYKAFEGFARSMNTSLSLSALLFSYYKYVWGTMARPELQLPASTGVLRGLDPRITSLILPALLAYPLLNPVSAYRILLVAPIPLAAAVALKPKSLWEPIIVAMAIASWIILIINSPPAFSTIPRLGGS